jgi:hypothetical protein
MGMAPMHGKQVVPCHRGHSSIAAQHIFACYAAFSDPALHKLLGIVRLLRISSKKAQSLSAAYSEARRCPREDVDGR